MSKKSKRNKPGREVPATAPAAAPAPTPAKPASRKGLFIGAGVVLIAAFVVATLLYTTEKQESSRQLAQENVEALASAHSPAKGPPDARVHIVEFLDPACETCADFYPEVKRLMAEHPGAIRVSMRHVPFHKGSEHVVRILEAARGQYLYWQTLEALFAAQDRWTVNHAVHVDQVWPALRGVGLDQERVGREMNGPDIAARMDKDSADAKALNVTKTPEFFVNGRPLPRFGLKELRDLVNDEVRKTARGPGS